MNIYPSFAQGLLDDDDAHHVDLNTDDVRVILLNGYTYSAAHDYLNDITGASTEIARSGAIDNVSVTNGTLDHDDEVVSAVAGGSTITDVVYYKYNASDASAAVICHIDENASGGALSVATNGSDVTIQPHVNGVFDLV